MKRREFFRTMGGALAAAAGVGAPAVAVAASMPQEMPLVGYTRGIVAEMADNHLKRIAEDVVGYAETNWHFQIRWKRIVEHTREALGIPVDYRWSTIVDESGHRYISTLEWCVDRGPVQKSEILRA